MRLYEKYAPRSLAEIVGQPDVWELRQFVKEPYPSCWLFAGDPGVGKNATADALVHDLGVHEDDYHVRDGSEMKVDVAKFLLGGPLRYVGRSDRGWKVLLIEELEFLSKETLIHLKDKLQRDLPSKTVVLATSNDYSKLPEAFLERFRIRKFVADQTFAQAAAERLAWIWRQETGKSVPPAGYEQWGWKAGDDGPRYSLRAALDEMQHYLTLTAAVREQLAVVA